MRKAVQRMTPEKMIEIPEWLARKLIEVLVLELEETRDLLKLKECELDAIYEDEMEKGYRE